MSSPKFYQTAYLGLTNVSCPNISDETGNPCLSVRGEVHREYHPEYVGFISCVDCLNAVKYLSDRDLVSLVSGGPHE